MPKFSDVVIAPSFAGFPMWGGFGTVFYVGNSTNVGDGQGRDVSVQGRSPKNPFTSIAAALTAASSGRGDVIVIQRGTYTENLTVSKNGVTLVGAVPFGYPDHVVISGRTVVSATNVTFMNMEFFSNDATLPSVRTGAFSDSANTIRSIWLENCSFASDGTTEPEAGLLVFGGLNIVVRRCWFMDNTYGVVIRPTSGEHPSNVVIEDCHFDEGTTAYISDQAAGFSGLGNLGASEGVGNNFRMRGCYFGHGTAAPTDFINIGGGGVSTGSIADCVFASTVHASSTITIPAGILYLDNAAEEGRTGTYASNIGTSGRPD